MLTVCFSSDERRHVADAARRWRHDGDAAGRHDAPRRRRSQDEGGRQTHRRECPPPPSSDTSQTMGPVHGVLWSVVL